MPHDATSNQDGSGSAWLSSDCPSGVRPLISAACYAGRAGRVVRERYHHPAAVTAIALIACNIEAGPNGCPQHIGSAARVFICRRRQFYFPSPTVLCPLGDSKNRTNILPANHPAEQIASPPRRVGTTRPVNWTETASRGLKATKRMLSVKIATASPRRAADRQRPISIARRKARTASKMKYGRVQESTIAPRSSPRKQANAFLHPGKVSILHKFLSAG